MDRIAEWTGRVVGWTLFAALYLAAAFLVAAVVWGFLTGDWGVDVYDQEPFP